MDDAGFGADAGSGDAAYRDCRQNWNQRQDGTLSVHPQSDLALASEAGSAPPGQQAIIFTFTFPFTFTYSFPFPFPFPVTVISTVTSPSTLLFTSSTSSTSFLSFLSLLSLLSLPPFTLFSARPCSLAPSLTPALSSPDIVPAPTSSSGDPNYFFSAAVPATVPAATSNAVDSVPSVPSVASVASVAAAPNCTSLPARDDFVSPIETRASTAVFRTLDRRGSAAHHLPAQPLTRFSSLALRRPPTSSSLAGASSLDDLDRRLSLCLARRGSFERTASWAPATTSAIAHDVAHLTDEGSDDWFRFTLQESVISKYTNLLGEHKLSAMAANGSGQQRQDSLLTPTSPAAVSPSFTWLPPISRTSTINLSRKTGLTVDGDNDTAPSPIEKDSPRSPGPQQDASNGQWQSSATSAIPQPAPHTALPPQSRQQTPTPNLISSPNPGPQPSQSAMPPPNGPVAAAQPLSQRGPPLQAHPHQMMMGRGAGKQVAPGQMMVNGQVISMPGGLQWTPQESTLAVPLIDPSRKRSGQNLRAYAAYDKETEGQAAPPPQQHVNATSSQPPQPRPPNTTNPGPPAAAMRAFPRPPFLRGQKGGGAPGDMSDDKSFKETARVDSVSGSSITSDDAESKRGLHAFLGGLGHQRNSSGTTAVEQGTPSTTSDKKSIFSTVAGFTQSQSKFKPNPILPTLPTFNESDQAALQETGDHEPVKKRLSELKGMIRGVGHAKEGVKDDQPTKIETIYEYRPPREDSPPQHASAPALEGEQGQPSQSAPQAPPVSIVSSLRPGGLRPRPSMDGQPSQATTQPVAKGPTAFMGISRASTSDPQPGQVQVQPVKSEEGGKKSSAAGFLGGLFSKQANKTKEIKPQSSHLPPTSQQPTQPPIHSGYQPFRPGQMSLPGQQLGPHPMFAGQPRAQRGQSPSPTLFQDPTQPLPPIETAQAIPRRRPAEITISPHSPSGRSLSSSHKQSNISLSNLPQSSLNKYVGAASYGQRPAEPESQDDDSTATSRPSIEFSDKSSDEKANVENPSTMSRVPPIRKPVKSSNAKGNVPFMTPALPPTIADPNRPRASDEQRAPSQLSQYRQSPQLTGESPDLRRPSLPSPEPSPVPSQSDRSSSKPPGGHLTRNNFDPREAEKGLGVLSNGLDLSVSMNASGANGSLAPHSAATRAQSPYTPSSPTPSTDQGKLSRFFGAYDGGKPAAQSQASKEKSAASKFFNAFKRGGRSSEPAQISEHRPQTSPQTAQPGIRSFSPNPASQDGMAPLVNSVPGSSGQPKPQLQPQPQPHGQAQVPKPRAPQQMQAGRGQIPPSMVPGAAGPFSPNSLQPAAPRTQSGEPQYDLVPIPRQYVTVQKYDAAGGTFAPPRYHAGHPNFPGVQYAQHPVHPPVLQPGYPMQQWDPRRMPFPQPGLPPGAVPPQGPPNIPHQAPPPHPQLQVQPPNPSSSTQSLPPTLQTEIAPQLPRRRVSPPQPAQPMPASQSAPGLSQIITGPAQNSQPSKSQSHAHGPGPAQMQHNNPWAAVPPKPQAPAPQPTVEPAPVVSNPPSNRTPSPPTHHIAAAAPAQAQAQAQPQPQPQPQVQVQVQTQVQAQVQARSASPAIHATNPAPFQQPRDKERPASPRIRSPDAARLTSRMSVSRHGTKDIPARPGAPLQISVDDRSLENVKYAGSERRFVNGTGSTTQTPGSVASSTVIATPDTTAGAGASATLPEDNMSFLDGSEDSDLDERPAESGVGGKRGEKEVAVQVSPPLGTVEPEEKIPVDFPVELAAVHDDDDGMPMMSATSYPGQEWNPYGAGEFGDWE
ncbi:hypothetical protein F4861DRAFT_535795 [Xylaria intraflava]|nr:hypothetical protein F4861DRAFT_535795 [Xylaria intraflava]